MLDRRDEILNAEYFTYYRPSFPSDERTVEVVKMALCIKEETAAIKNAMDENAKQMCLDLLEYMAKNNYKCFWMEDDDGDPYYLFSKGVGYQNLTKEQLFENFL